MGSGLAKVFRKGKAILDRLDNSNSTFTRGSVTPICSSLSLCSYCGACTGEARWPSQKTSTSIFRLRSSKLIKEKLYRIGEGIICCVDGLQEASALFSSISYNCSFIIASEGHNEEYKSY
jgi:hypothetical protein